MTPTIVRTDRFLSIVIQAPPGEWLHWKDANAHADEYLASTIELGGRDVWEHDESQCRRRSDFVCEVHYKLKEGASTGILRADVCPVCKRENVTGDQFTVEMSIAYQGVRCEDCGSRWVVAFQTWAIRIVHDGTQADG